MTIDKSRDVWAVLADPTGMFSWYVSPDRPIPSDLKLFAIFRGGDAYERAGKYMEENKNRFKEIWFSKH